MSASDSLLSAMCSLLHFKMSAREIDNWPLTLAWVSHTHKVHPTWTASCKYEETENTDFLIGFVNLHKCLWRYNWLACFTGGGGWLSDQLLINSYMFLCWRGGGLQPYSPLPVSAPVKPTVEVPSLIIMSYVITYTVKKWWAFLPTFGDWVCPRQHSIYGVSCPPNKSVLPTHL